jgi:DNA-binding beta-propeller fold protein YncE
MPPFLRLQGGRELESTLLSSGGRPAHHDFPRRPRCGTHGDRSCGPFPLCSQSDCEFHFRFPVFWHGPELLEATGAFIGPHTSGSPFSIGAEPIALATDFSTPFLYVVCDDDTLRVYEMDYAAGGYIAQAASLKLAGLPVGVAAEPGGRFVYAATAGAVSGFSVDYGSGALTPLASSIAIPSQVFGLYAEPSGKFLYVGTVAGVLGYSINADGTLTAVSAQPVATPKQPSSMSVSVGIQ